MKTVPCGGAPTPLDLATHFRPYALPFSDLQSKSCEGKKNIKHLYNSWRSTSDLYKKLVRNPPKRMSWIDRRNGCFSSGQPNRRAGSAVQDAPWNKETYPELLNDYLCCLVGAATKNEDRWSEGAAPFINNFARAWTKQAPATLQQNIARNHSEKGACGKLRKLSLVLRCLTFLIFPNFLHCSPHATFLAAGSPNPSFGSAWCMAIHGTYYVQPRKVCGQYRSATSPETMLEHVFHSNFPMADPNIGTMPSNGETCTNHLSTAQAVKFPTQIQFWNVLETECFANSFVRKNHHVICYYMNASCIHCTGSRGVISKICCMTTANV